MKLQTTIKKEVTFSGIGLHTGKPATVKLKPASRDTGIVFYRVDKGAIIRASVDFVIDTAFATTLGYNGTKVKTVEHLLSAIAGLGISNLLIEINGPEVPILDGSAIELVNLINHAGIAKQAKPSTFIKILKPVVYEDAHARVIALPYDGTRYSYSIDFAHSLLGYQEIAVELNALTYSTEIAPARTFGFLKDVQMLKSRGFAQGGSLKNAIVIAEDRILNEGGLRYPDEFVRHKLLDSVGDISLIGYQIQGHIIFEKSGHTANYNFLKKLLASPDAFKLTTASAVQTNNLSLRASN